MDLISQMRAFQPWNEQEERDREVLLHLLTCGQAPYGREDPAHLTASAWVVSPDRKQVLMAYHNIFRSWSWTGGHADGEEEMLPVAKREATEETGVKNLRVLLETTAEGPLAAVDVLPVWGHVKRGKYVCAHQHLNYSYLFEADEEETLHIKADENSQVGWIPVPEIREKVTEPDMIPVYEKLIRLGAR